MFSEEQDEKKYLKESIVPEENTKNEQSTLKINNKSEIKEYKEKQEQTQSLEITKRDLPKENTPTAIEIEHNIKDVLKILDFGNGKIKITFILTKAEQLNSEEEAYKKIKDRIKLQGFRPGKVPLIVARRLYGAFLLEESLKTSFETKFEQIKKELPFKIFSIVKTEANRTPENNFSYDVTTLVCPPIDLGIEYKGIEIKKRSATPTQEEIDERILAIQKKHGREVSKEKIVEEGDYVNINYRVFLNDNELSDNAIKNFKIQIGSHTAIPGFEEKIIGASADDELDFEIEFPKEFYDKRLEGKTGRFKVRVNSVFELEIPELNDEFVQTVSEFENLEDFKSEIALILEKENTARIKRESYTEILDILRNNTKMEINDEIILREAKKNFAIAIQQTNIMGMMAKFNMSIEHLWNTLAEEEKEKAFADAKINLGNSLIISRIAQLEDIHISEVQIENRINEILVQNPGIKKEEINEEVVKNELEKKMVLEFLLKNVRYLD